jgi:hypothetical protein
VDPEQVHPDDRRRGRDHCQVVGCRLPIGSPPKGGGPSSSPAYPSRLAADHPTVDLPGGTTDVLSCRTATDSRLAKRHLRTLAWSRVSAPENPSPQGAAVDAVKTSLPSGVMVHHACRRRSSPLARVHLLS